MLVMITGLAAEARLLRKLGCIVLVGGGTPEGAGRQAEAAIAKGATALISFGLAGGLDPAMPPGRLVVPRQVLWRSHIFQADAALCAALGGATCDTLLADDAIAARADQKRALHQATGATAIDLESGAVAEWANRHGLPFAVLRAICDPAGRDLPQAALAALDTAGAIGLGRVAGSVIRNPGQIPALLALARDARSARRTLIDRVATLSTAGALLPWTSP
jgi:adenosylhomocysteine nucleosidase